MRRAPVRNHHSGGGAIARTGSPTVVTAVRRTADRKRRRPDRSARMLSACTTPPAMSPNGSRIAGMIPIAAPRRTARPGPPVNADFACCAAAHSATRPRRCVRRRDSAMTRTCDTSPMDFASRATCDPEAYGGGFFSITHPTFSTGASIRYLRPDSAYSIWCLPMRRIVSSMILRP